MQSSSADSIVLAVSFFPAPARTSTRPRSQDLAWSDLAKLLRQHARSHSKDGRGWSPATFAPNTSRGNQNVRAVAAFVGDRDHATFGDYAAIKENLRDL